MMKAILLQNSWLAMVVSCASLASAQGNVPFWGNYGYGYHSSTYEEGVQRGAAAWNQSVGQRNYLNSLAAIKFEEAYSRYLKNQAQRVDTYFSMRQANREARRDYAPRRLSTEQLATMAKKAAPASLNENEYDRTIGRVYWPAALHADVFAPERDALERAFRARSVADYGPNSEFYDQVHRLTTVMQDTLRAYKGNLDAAQYVAANNFIRSLAYEARQPLMPRAVAAAMR